jgi:hypothetical protein
MTIAAPVLMYGRKITEMLTNSNGGKLKEKNELFKVCLGM